MAQLPRDSHSLVVEHPRVSFQIVVSSTVAKKHLDFFTSTPTEPLIKRYISSFIYRGLHFNISFTLVSFTLCTEPRIFPGIERARQFDSNR